MRTMTDSAYSRLEKYFEKYSVLNNIKSMLEWDAKVNLPKASWTARERQVKCVEGDISDFLRKKSLSDLLENIDESSLGVWQKKNLKLIHKIKEENAIYPKRFLENIAAESMRCEILWRKAKEKSNFSIVKNSFKALLSLAKEKAKRRGEWLGKSPYEALMDIYSPQLKIETTEKLFKELKEKLPAIIAQARGRGEPASSINLNEGRKFSEFAKQFATKMGFKFSCGRIDTSSHPFCSGYYEDVRMTHDYNGKNFVSALYGVIHETGHGLYLQGLPRRWVYQPVGQVCDCAADEASALLCEFFIGRSKYFSEKIYKAISGRADGDEKLTFFRGLKEIKSNNSIRINADVVTYPLHIILRYEIEKLLFNGDLEAEDVPECWRRKHRELLGFEISSEAEGCLQDMHWYVGYFGYFPSYCVGAIFAAQMYFLLGFNELQDTKGLKKKLCDLKKSFFGYGSLYGFEGLVKKCTGAQLDTSYYYRFIEAEYL